MQKRLKTGSILGLWLAVFVVTGYMTTGFLTPKQPGGIDWLRVLVAVLVGLTASGITFSLVFLTRLVMTRRFNRHNAVEEAAKR